MSKDLLVKAIDELSEYVLNNHEAYAIVRGYNQTPEEHDYFGFGGLYWAVVKQAAACNLAHAVPKAETHSTEQWSPSKYNDEAVVGILVLCDSESFLIDLSKLRAQATDTVQADNDEEWLTSTEVQWMLEPDAFVEKDLYSKEEPCKQHYYKQSLYRLANKPECEIRCNGKKGYGRKLLKSSVIKYAAAEGLELNFEKLGDMKPRPLRPRKPKTA